MHDVLVVRVCAIGDFVLNLPALIALQKKFPTTRFTLVGYPSSLEPATEFVTIRSIHSIELQPWARLFYEPVPGLEFDSAIVWMKDDTVAGNLRLSGIPNVLRTDPFPTYGHAADHLLRTLNLEPPGLPDLWASESDSVLIHTGSGSRKKNWPHFNVLMNRLKGAVPLPKKLTLGELSQYLRRCRAYVGNDSGITHLAAYIGCPTIALFGPTDPRIWGPIGRRIRIIWKSKLEDITEDEILQILYATHT